MAADDPSRERAAKWLARFDVILTRFENGLNLVAAIAIFSLMLMGVVQIVGRSFFDFPLPGYIDYIEQFIGIFAFLGVAYCQRIGGHVRMDLLITKLPRRMQPSAEALGVGLTLLLITLLIWGSYQHFERAYLLGDSTMDIRLPVWPSKLLVPIALSVLWLRLVVQFSGYVRLARFPDSLPIGIPLALDSHEHGDIERGAGEASVAFPVSPGPGDRKC
jgi:TRAP-type C4-dicarboxylate transport system permease small subunit